MATRDIEKHIDDTKIGRPLSSLPPSVYGPVWFRRIMKIITVSAALLGLASVVSPSPLDKLLAARQNADSSSTETKIDRLTAAYTAPSAFPTSAFRSYYNSPASMTAEPRPVVTDVGRNAVYPDILANPTVLPNGPSSTEAVYPLASGQMASSDIAPQVKSNLTAILASSVSNCTKCTDALKVAHILARQAPQEVPELLIELCKQYEFKSATQCEKLYQPQVLGSSYAQVLSYADFTTKNSTDAQYICSIVVGSAVSDCTLPDPKELTTEFLDEWFGGKRIPPTNYNTHVGEPTSDGHDLRVLHISDIHVDPRFFVGGEASCTNGRCCRADSYNSTVSNSNFTAGLLPLSNVSEPSVYWGNYECDAPWSLTMAALESVTPLNGGSPVDMTIHTGDMVVHDLAQYISRDLVEYTHQSLYDSFRKFLGTGPVFNAIGNHDTSPSDFASQGVLPDGRSDQFSWDWDNLARLWQSEGWFNAEQAEQVRTHYAGYSISPRKGLRIITINTDFWYKNNVFNMINTQNPDFSGSLRFLTDELFHAEKRGERVWIVGHVLTGWDGTNPLDNPTNLFYQIVDRFAPHCIAHIFFGHTHEDQFNLFYSTSTNGSVDRSTEFVKAVSFMGPSVTPGNNVNPALRIMEVNSTTYEVMDYHQFYSSVSDFPNLPESGHGPVFQYLYSARDAYGNFTASNSTSSFPLSDGVWPRNAPLNATFWSKLTEEMTARPELVQEFTVYQGRNSPKSSNCTSQACIDAKICYMRSGSASLGKLCPQGYGSVQS